MDALLRGAQNGGLVLFNDDCTVRRKEGSNNGKNGIILMVVVGLRRKVNQWRFDDTRVR